MEVWHVSDKTFRQLGHFYFWPRMRSEVEKFVRRCRVCQHAKGRSQNTRLYTPFLIPICKYFEESEGERSKLCAFSFLA